MGWRDVLSIASRTHPAFSRRPSRRPNCGAPVPEEIRDILPGFCHLPEGHSEYHQITISWGWAEEEWWHGRR